jgi:hypothetical protein
VIEGVIIAGDLLRPDGSGRPGAQTAPRSAVKRSIYLAAGLATEPLTAATTSPLHQWIESLRARLTRTPTGPRSMRICPGAHRWSNTSSSAFAGASASATKCRRGWCICWTSWQYPTSIYACTLSGSWTT